MCWAQRRALQKPKNHALDGAFWFTLAPPDEYNRTIGTRRRYDIISNYFNHLLVVITVRLNI